MSHDELRADLASYALGLLESGAVATLEAHLASCDECRQELAGHLETAAFLAESFAQIDPPAHLKAQILRQVQPPSAKISPRWPLLLAAAVFIALLFFGPILTLGHNQRDLTAQVEQARQEAGRLQKSLAAREAQLALFETATRIVPLEGEKSANVRLLVNPDGYGVLLGDLPRVPGNIYQVWLIAGKTPVSAGVFPSAPEQAGQMALSEPLQNYQMIAITLEKSEVIQSTSKPLWIGKI